MPVTHHCGYEGRLDLALQEVVPEDVPEELLLLHVLRVALRGAQALVRVLPQQLAPGGGRGKGGIIFIYSMD